MTASDARAELLRRRLGSLRETPRRTIPRLVSGAAPQLSLAQERVWFMEQLVPGTTAYHVCTAVPVPAATSAELISDALTELAAKHIALRCAFPSDDAGLPTVVVLDRPAIAVEVSDPGAEPVASTIPFDVEHGPLLRARLHPAPERDSEAMLLIEAHHLVTDGWSTDIVVRDLGRLLRGDPLGPDDDAVDYLDFAAWQRGRDTSADLEFWRSQLSDAANLELPMDRPRPEQQTFAGRTHHRVMEQGEAQAADLARSHGCSVFTVLLSVYQTVLGRLADQTDFVVGTPTAGRSHTELEPLVGMFVNMLPLRADLSGDVSFARLLERNHERFLTVMDHQDMPFEKLVQDLDIARDPARSPLFQSTLALQNFHRSAVAGGAGWSPVELSSTRFDLEWRVAQTGSGLWCEVTYNRDLFDEATISALMDMVEYALAAVAGDPEICFSATPLGDPPPSQHPSDEAVERPRLAEEIVDLRRRGDHCAVRFEDEHLSWPELDDWADAICAHLSEAGCAVDSVVALDATRSLALIPTVVGILRAGCAFLPLDPDLPQARRDRMLELAGAEVVLSLRDQHEARGRGGSAPPSCVTAPSDAAAYVLFTSGSTGEPKGVVNTVGGLENRLRWMRDHYGVGVNDVILQKTPASFDVCVWEMLLPVISGAEVVLARPGGHRDPEYLASVSAETGTTLMHFVPSMLAAFEGADQRLPESVRQVICSGEALPRDLVERFLLRHPQAAIDNLYGPTEAAVDVTFHRCDRASAGADVPIGRPIPGNTIHVVDSAMRRVPQRVPGDLHIGGLQVARGYVGAPGLTAARFGPDPFCSATGTMYDSGDRARVDPDGNLRYLGRSDDQVKLRGQRIELNEIAVALRRHPDVDDAAVIVREDRPGDVRLAAYVAGEPSIPDLRRHLERELPAYMVPSSYTRIEHLPTTPNGKLDRGRLPRPEAETVPDGPGRSPESPSEVLMATLWSQILEVDIDSVEADFFEQGGHSLLAARLVAAIRKARESGLPSEVSWAPVSVMDVFTHRRLHDLVDHAEGRAGDGNSGLLHRLTGERGGVRRRLVCIPYGGGSAAVYQPLADQLPQDTALHAVAIPGHDVGTEEEPVPFSELVSRIADEVLTLGPEPLRLYGHCGVGTAMITAVALELEERGRDLDAVYAGAMFPIAKVPRGRGLLDRLNRLESNRSHQNWLKSMGVDMGDLEPAHADRIVANMRRDSTAAEDWFTAHYEGTGRRLNAPIVSVVGDQDPVTDFYEERFREWTSFAREARLTVLPGAGHFFLKHRASELASIVSSPVQVFRAASEQEPTSTPPSMSRFAAVAIPQTITLIGSAMTAWALPIYLYLEQGSLGGLAMLALTGLVPMLVVTPVAGAVSDRFNRRRVMMVAGCASLLIQCVLLGLVVSGSLMPWMLYVLVVLLASASSFQRVAYMAAVPQVVPKRFLAHAMGFVQLSASVSTLIVPVIAAGLMAAVGLRAIVSVNVATWVIALTVLALVRFPDLAGRTAREGWLTAVAEGFRYVRSNPAMRRMIGLSALVNVFIAPALLLLVPLVLSMGDTSDMGRISLIEGSGAVAAGFAVVAWGGPRIRRMRGALLVTAVLGLAIAVMGLRPSLVFVALGVLGLAASIEILQATYATIIQTKVPQRLHGRLLSLNIMLSWSTLPVGYLLGVWAASLLDPLMAVDGAWSGTALASLVGAGPGRGIGLTLVAAGSAILVVAVLAMSRKSYWNFDTTYADDVPDDLLGVREAGRRAEFLDVDGVVADSAGDSARAGHQQKELSR